MDIALDEIRRTLREQLPQLQDAWGLASLELFGSRVRGDAREDSDLDLLVSFVEPIGLFRFVELENTLTDLLGVKVDLVMRDALKPRIGKRILAEAIPL
jgi:predicted nucleotidyltransferase